MSRAAESSRRRCRETVILPPRPLAERVERAHQIIDATAP